MVVKLLKANEGYTLILVLLTITIIGIFAPPIISNIMSSMLQNQKTEQNLQLAKLEDMGITYINSAIDKAIEELDFEIGELTESEDIANAYKDQFIVELDNYLFDNDEILLTESRTNFRVVVEPEIEINTANSIEITYVITSILNPTKSKVKTETRTINLDIQ